MPPIRRIGRKYLSTNGIAVFIENTNRQVKYIAPSNHAALTISAKNLFTLNFFCRALTSGCNPKNRIKGKVSQILNPLNASVKRQVATYESAQPI